MPIRQAGSPRGVVTALIRLTVSLQVAFVLGGVLPRTADDGWLLGDTLAAAAVLLGAWWAGRRYYQPLLFAVDGMAGGLLVCVVLGPGHWHSVSTSTDMASVLAYFAGAAAIAIACPALGWVLQQRGKRDAKVG